MDLIIRVSRAEFKQYDGYSTCTTRPLERPAHQEPVSCRNAAELNAALDRVADSIRSNNPSQSYRVSAFAAHKAQRAFAGFRQGRWFRDVDANDAKGAGNV